MNEDLYRRLADAGDENAKAILDAGDEGATPEAEMAEGGSESDATEDLAAFAEKVGALKAKADILAAAGDYKGAADTHMSRAREFDWRDSTARR